MAKHESTGPHSGAKRTKGKDGTPPPAMPSEAMHETEDAALEAAMVAAERGIPPEIDGLYKDLVALISATMGKLKTPTAAIPVADRRAIAQAAARMMLGVKDPGRLGLHWPVVPDAGRHAAELPPTPMFPHLTEAQLDAIARARSCMNADPASQEQLADDACFLFGLASRTTPLLQAEQIARMAARRRENAQALQKQLAALREKHGDAESIPTDGGQKPNPYRVLCQRLEALHIDADAICAEDEDDASKAAAEFDRLRKQIIGYMYRGRPTALAHAWWDLFAYTKKDQFKSGVFLQSAAEGPGVLAALRTNPPHADVQALRRGHPQPFEMFGYGKAIDGSNPGTDGLYLRMFVPPFVPTYPLHEVGNFVIDQARFDKMTGGMQKAMTQQIEEAKHNLQASNMPYEAICAEIAPGVPQPTNALMDLHFAQLLALQEKLFLQLLANYTDIQGLLAEAAGDSNLANGASLGALLADAENNPSAFIATIRDRMLYGAYCKFASKFTWVRRENNDADTVTDEKKRQRPCWLSVRASTHLLLIFTPRANYTESAELRERSRMLAGPTAAAILDAELPRLRADKKNEGKIISLKPITIIDRLDNVPRRRQLPVPVVADMPYECGVSLQTLFAADWDMRGSLDAVGATFVAGDPKELHLHAAELRVRSQGEYADECLQGMAAAQSASSKELEAQMQRASALAMMAGRRAAAANNDSDA